MGPALQILKCLTLDGRPLGSLEEARAYYETILPPKPATMYKLGPELRHPALYPNFADMNAAGVFEALISRHVAMLLTPDPKIMKRLVDYWKRIMPDLTHKIYMGAMASGERMTMLQYIEHFPDIGKSKKYAKAYANMLAGKLPTSTFEIFQKPFES
jgi:hypothetical protein